jgi:hypothetical protein
VAVCARTSLHQNCFAQGMRPQHCKLEHSLHEKQPLVQLYLLGCTKCWEMRSAKARIFHEQTNSKKREGLGSCCKEEVATQGSLEFAVQWKTLAGDRFARHDLWHLPPTAACRDDDKLYIFQKRHSRHHVDRPLPARAKPAAKRSNATGTWARCVWAQGFAIRRENGSTQGSTRGSL